MMASGAFTAVPEVDIDPNGRFKYILIKLYSGVEDNFKYIVRGYARCGFHADIYDEVYERVHPLGLETECVGGGRILHEAGKKHITVFGYSQGYGRADHSKSVEVLKKHFRDYEIDWNNDGY